MGLLGFILGEVNWSNISNDWADWMLTGYRNILGDWVYPLIFMGIVGYVYCINRSATSAAVAICLIFTVFGVTGVFAGSDEHVVLMSIVSIVSFSVLFVHLFIGKFGK